MTADGRCDVCDEYKTPDADKKSCITNASCGSRVRIDIDGNCITAESVCPDYQKLSDDKRTCIAPTCAADKVISKTGTCDDPTYTSNDGNCVLYGNQTPVKSTKHANISTVALCKAKCVEDAVDCTAY